MTKSQTKWFKATWEGTINPMYSVAYFPREERKNYGRGRKLCIWIFKKDNFWMAYDNNDLLRLGRYVANKITSNKISLKKIYNRYGFYVKELEKNFTLTKKDNLKNLSNEQLFKLYDDLILNYVGQFGWSTICEPLGIFLQEEIEKHYKIKNNEKIKNIIFSPTNFSFLQKEEFSLYQISLLIIKEKKLTCNRQARQNLTFNNLKSNLPTKILNKLKKHEKDFFWIKNNYAGSTYLNVDYFLKETIKILKNNGFKEKEITRKIKNIEKNKISLSKKLVILNKIKADGKLKAYTKILDNLMGFQDCRKAIAMKTIAFLDLVNKEIARRAKLSSRQVKYLLPDEIKDILVKNKYPKISELNERRKKCILIWNKNKLKISTKANIVDQWEKKILFVNKAKRNILKGTPASKGLVRGVAKVLHSPKEINKIKQDDILVATNTTPDYVFAMKKAKAILTEKGGMTSHAAIVSRELKIPCIVGVNNITQILKDGNLVEVNADKGIIKIIK